MLLSVVSFATGATSNTYGQYRDPFLEKSKKPKKQKKKLFGKGKTKTLKKGDDPFKEKSKKKDKTKKSPFSSKKKNGKGRIKEKDSFASKDKNKLYNKKYSKKKKTKVKTKNKRSSGKKSQKAFVMRRNRTRTLKEPDSFVSKPTKDEDESQYQSLDLFPKGVNPARY